MENQRQFEEAAGELSQLVYEGKVAGLGIVIILRGKKFARTISRFDDGLHFHLIAGIAHLQHDLLHDGETLDSPDESHHD